MPFFEETAASVRKAPDRPRIDFLWHRTGFQHPSLANRILSGTGLIRRQLAALRIPTHLIRPIPLFPEFRKEYCTWLTKL